jgi:hypothetical protein
MSYCSPKDTAWHFGRLEFFIELPYIWDGVRQTVGLRFTKLLGGVISIVQTFTVRILPCNGEEVPSWNQTTVQLYQRYCSCINGTVAVSAVLQLYQRYCSCISSIVAVSAVLQLYQRYCSCISSIVAVSAVLQLYQRYRSCTIGTAAVSAVLQLYQRYCSCTIGTAAVSAVLPLYKRYCMLFIK